MTTWVTAYNSQFDKFNPDNFVLNSMDNRRVEQQNTIYDSFKFEALNSLEHKNKLVYKALNSDNVYITNETPSSKSVVILSKKDKIFYYLKIIKNKLFIFFRLMLVTPFTFM